MTTPDLLRSIRVALETHRDGAAFRAEVKRLIDEHDTPPMFPEDPKGRTVRGPFVINRQDFPLRDDAPRLFPDPPEKGAFGFD